MLEANEREDLPVVARWAELMGLKWYEIPPLRQVIEHVAVQLLANNMPDRPPGDANRLAAEALGLEDNDEGETHPGDRFARTLCNWQRAAAGKIFQPKKSDAA